MVGMGLQCRLQSEIQPIAGPESAPGPRHPHALSGLPAALWSSGDPGEERHFWEKPHSIITGLNM